MLAGLKLTGSDHVSGVYMYFSLCTMLCSACIAEIKGRFFLSVLSFLSVTYNEFNRTCSKSNDLI